MVRKIPECDVDSGESDHLPPVSPGRLGREDGIISRWDLDKERKYGDRER